MKSTSPELRKQVIALRAVGYSLAEIKISTDLSISTIQRICKRSGVKKAELEEELVERAKVQMLSACESDELQHLVKRNMLETLAQVSMGREKAAEILDQLELSEENSWPQAFRALAAHSTAIKNYADTARHLLPDVEVKVEPEEFVVRVITEDEIEALKENQTLEFEEVVG